ncbi:MAG: hypothetical protein J7M27_08400 [Candidatus Latescibacteria bacterium]|nr:hypothetical protein [Candidatus Latescibacterota bacterium]
MPESPVFAESVLHVRDKLIALVVIRKRIGLPERAYGKDTWIIIVC